MKKNVLVLSLLLIVGFGLQAQQLVSITPIDTTQTFTINFVANGLAKYNVANFKIVYNTPDANGNSSTASGLLSMPIKNCTDFSMVVYNHGTVLERNEVPSRNNFESLIGKVFASRGYVTLMPDYLGLGDSPGLHPYLHAETQATATIDMMRAVREAITDSLSGYNLNTEVFLTGYSQGGHACMATAKYIKDENLQTEFNVVAAAPASGPYDLTGSQASIFINDQPYSNPGYVVYLLLGMNEGYGGTLFNNPSEILKAPYDVTIPPYFNGNYPMDSVNNKLPSRVSQYLEDSVLNAFIADTVNQNHWIWMILNDNSNYDWRPDMEMRMYYCTNDEQVNFQNSLAAHAAMTANGATMVKAVGKGPFNHGGCVAPSIEGAARLFDSLSTGCSSFIGLEAYAQAEVDVYPNPFNAELKIAGLEEESIITVFDLNGRIVGSYTAAKEIELPLAHLPKGIYLLEIRSDNYFLRKRVVRE